MKLVLLGENDYKDYDGFIKSFESSLFYHSIKYKLFLENILACKSEYWLVKEENTIVGVLPLMYKDGKYGKVYNSLPYYGSNGGIITRSKEAYKLLLNKYNTISISDDVAASNLVNNPLNKSEFEGEITKNESDYRIGQFTPLNLEVEEGDTIENVLISSFHYKTRNMIRKALKSEIVSEVDNSKLDFLNRVHVENMEAIGGKPKNGAFFNEIPNYFTEREDYNIYVAKKDGQAIGALLLFYYNNTVEYFTPVTKAGYRNLQPMSVLVYNAMVEASKSGYKRWNWGGTWESQEGVYRFKKRWNTEDINYDYCIQITNKDIYKSTKEELLKEYKDFFVIPFDLLKSNN